MTREIGVMLSYGEAGALERYTSSIVLRQPRYSSVGRVFGIETLHQQTQFNFSQFDWSGTDGQQDAPRTRSTEKSFANAKSK